MNRLHSGWVYGGLILAVLGMDFVLDPQVFGIPNAAFHWLSLAEAGEPSYPEIRNSWTADGVFEVEVWNEQGPSGEWVLQCNTNSSLASNLWVDIPPVISNTAAYPIVLSDSTAPQADTRIYRVLRRVSTFP